ncbi:MAG TPA: TIR domain-containing protein, partial [Thermomicrobiaceae bacterium]|nr:TIR domain-containing protein [Thermomicrobiaceae bacterium]
MDHRVFFSFDYDRDSWRANRIRNSGALHDLSVTGFWDQSLWESCKQAGNDAVKRLIDDGLEDTSVTVVLIGASTASRGWVRYAIQRSYNRGNGLLGIYIHNIPDARGRSDFVGASPFRALQIYFDF